MGTRLKPVLKDIPKCLAPINGTPFIDIVLGNCIDQGLKRFILCVGYLKEHVIKYLGDRNDCEIIFSEEEELLGTGGALKNAEKYIRTDQVLVLNGDTFVEINYSRLIDWHNKNHSEITIAINYMQKVGRFGVITIDDNNKIIKFIEKGPSTRESWISAGVYLINKSIFNNIELEKNISLEKDLFPSYIGNNIYGYKNYGDMIDIGIPGSFSEAQMKLKKLL